MVLVLPVIGDCLLFYGLICDFLFTVLIWLLFAIWFVFGCACVLIAWLF